MTDHVATALARLPSEYAEDANVIALVTALVTPAQALETALLALLTDRAVNTAVGAQLDQLGVIVGQGRAGLSDADYRRYLRTKIKTNRSNATVEDLIDVVQLMIIDAALTVSVQRQALADIVIRLGGIAVTLSLATATATFLRQAKAAGVRLHLEYSSATPARTFRLDVGPGLDDADSLFADAV